MSRGEIRGVDVAGLAYLTLEAAGDVAGGKVRRVILVDERATPEQVWVLLDAIRGHLGGPLADLAATVAEELGAYQVPIEWSRVAHAGTVDVPGRVRIVVAPDASVPDPPGRAVRVAEVAVSIPEHGLAWTCRDRGGIAGEFWFEA